jgi:hypothetical protein
MKAKLKLIIGIALMVIMIFIGVKVDSLEVKPGFYLFIPIAICSIIGGYLIGDSIYELGRDSIKNHKLQECQRTNLIFLLGKKIKALYFEILAHLLAFVIVLVFFSLLFCLLVYLVAWLDPSCTVSLF